MVHIKVSEIFLRNSSWSIKNMKYLLKLNKKTFIWLSEKILRERYKRIKQQVRGVFIIGRMRILILYVANISFRSLSILIFNMLNDSSLTATLEYFGVRISQLPPLMLLRLFYSYSKPFLIHLKFDESL